VQPTETAELLERLEDSTMVLGGLAASRYSAPFRPQLQALQGRLGAVTETMDLWLTVQAAWSYVEAVFSGGDLAKQLPAEAKRFQLVDRAFMKAVAAARDSGRVIDACCDSDALRGPLPALLEQLETCQKGLAAYLGE
jgi:dynein heavy chain, axonemal